MEDRMIKELKKNCFLSSLQSSTTRKTLILVKQEDCNKNNSSNDGN